MSITIGYPASVDGANNLMAQGTVYKLLARYANEGVSMDEAISRTAEEIEAYKRV